MGRKRGDDIPDKKSSMCKGPVAGGKPGTTEHQNKWNRDCYVIGLEGWAGADHIDHWRPQKGL